MTLDDADSKLASDLTVVEIHDLPVAWGKTTSSYTRQTLESAWVQEHEILGRIDSAPVTDDSGNATATTTNLNVQGQQEKSTVLYAKQRVQDLDEEMKVAAETWKADKEIVLKIEEQVEKRQLKVCTFVCLCMHVGVWTCLSLSLSRTCMRPLLFLRARTPTPGGRQSESAVTIPVSHL